MANNETVQHYEFLNSFVSRMADKIETKTKGKNAQYPRVGRGVLERILSIFTWVPGVKILSWRRSSLHMNKPCHIVDCLMKH